MSHIIQITYIQHPVSGGINTATKYSLSLGAVINIATEFALLKRNSLYKHNCPWNYPLQAHFNQLTYLYYVQTPLALTVDS